MNQNLNTPVLFLIFNRPDITQKVFDVIKKVQPKQLFIVADGARNDEEWKECDKARNIINQVDWDCEIHKNYSDKNLGCKIRVSSGIDWFFENVEEGIILEDDCVPHQSFFYFCKELLDKYKNDDEIMCITGNNFQNNIKRGDSSYYFSIFNHCWGWASWRRAWQHFDIEMKSFPEFERKNKIKKISNQKIAQKYWLKNFQAAYENKVNSWAYIWTYTCWKQKGLTCLPNINLVSNIGFDEQATHTTDKNSKNANIPTQKIIFPLSHPKLIKVNKKADNYTNKYYFNIRRRNVLTFTTDILKKILRKLKLFNITKRIYLKTSNYMIKKI
ncbi:MAG: glycosyltransferase family 2 protein [Candidatus Pacebacteria bacterium]|nr:glycosyltransferase family 2 protein [Candidatus Paceibacterota bacterium]